MPRQALSFLTKPPVLYGRVRSISQWSQAGMRYIELIHGGRLLFFQGHGLDELTIRALMLLFITLTSMIQYEGELTAVECFR